MKEITLWYRWNESQSGYNDGFIYNHFSDGWDDSTQPVPVSVEQANSWKKKRWAKEFAYQDGSRIKHMDEI